MDREELKEAAEELDRLLAEHDQKGLRNALLPFIKKAIKQEIVDPLEWGDIPGDRSFSDGFIQNHPGLEEAYARFKVELTGGETSVFRRLRESMERGGPRET